MSQNTKPAGQQLLLAIVSLVSLFIVTGCPGRNTNVTPEPTPSPKGPTSKEAPGPAPSAILAGRTLHSPPGLTAKGEEAAKAVAAFIDWAGASLPEEQEDGRKALVGARDNADIVKAFTQEIANAQRTDHSRALLALALLGEMKSPAAEEFLRSFVNQPFPESGTKTEEGEILEQTALATLQAKAIDGLAYLHSKTADEEVLSQVQRHPSIIVRSEAISAYLWNQTNKDVGRRTLSQFVRKDEQRYLDQITRQAGERAASFNPKLEAYLKAHPEVVAPAPEGQRQDYGKPDQTTNPGAPPKF